MEATFPFFLVMALAVSGMFGGPSGRGSSDSAQAGPRSREAVSLQEKAKEKKPPILCSWIGYGKQETMCFREEMSVAQKKCNEYATKQLGEPAQCSCTGDQSYIQGACD